jgi:hypothetical protein
LLLEDFRRNCGRLAASFHGTKLLREMRFDCTKLRKLRFLGFRRHPFAWEFCLPKSVKVAAKM